MTSESTKKSPVILHLVPTLQPSGGELQLLNNLRHFDHSKFEHIVVYLRPLAQLLPEFERLGLRVECLDPGGKSGYLRKAFRLWRFARTNRLSLIHTTNAEADKLGGLVGFLAGVPVVSTLNAIAYDDDWFKRFSGLNIWKLRYMKYTRKLALRLFVKRYNAVSAAVKNSFVNSVGLSPDRIEVIYRGVDTRRFPKRSAKKFRPTGDRVFPRILTVGRLVGEKGHRFGIDAMRAIRRGHPNAELHIAGRGHMRASIEKQISELKLDDAVKLLGRRSDIPDLLSESDIFLFTSFSEGCPNALLEAMAVGLPCVAAASDAVLEIMTDQANGLLIPPGDADAISHAVLSLADDREKAIALGDAAADLIASRFTITRSAKALEDFYSRILKLPERIPAAQG